MLPRIVAICLLLLAPIAHCKDPDPTELIRKAMDHWRGLTSTSTMTMVIQRPDWQRAMTMDSWTRGDKHSLVRVTEPPKDRGNGTLLVDNNMWTFTPKINRVIKVPSSMMNQSWMGSDLSNKDVSKDTDIIDQYDHRLLEQYQQDEHQVYVIESIPHEEAAVVWGKEVVEVRDDYILLRQEFWDQDGILVKEMLTHEIEEMGGRTVAKRMRMQRLENPGEWTEMLVNEIDFDIEIQPSLFTLSNLRNPRR